MVSPVRAFAEGGIVTEPTVGLLGEKCPEMVVPLRSGAQDAAEAAAAASGLRRRGPQRDIGSAAIGPNGSPRSSPCW
jgi:hypothetical protein